MTTQEIDHLELRQAVFEEVSRLNRTTADLSQYEDQIIERALECSENFSTVYDLVMHIAIVILGQELDKSTTLIRAHNVNSDMLKQKVLMLNDSLSVMKDQVDSLHSTMKATKESHQDSLFIAKTKFYFAGIGGILMGSVGTAAIAAMLGRKK